MATPEALGGEETATKETVGQKSLPGVLGTTGVKTAACIRAEHMLQR